jgi:hypothetical protein
MDAILIPPGDLLALGLEQRHTPIPIQRIP